MNDRSVILYRIATAVLILLGPGFSILTIWLTVSHDLARPLIAIFIFGGAALFGCGLWLWVSEYRILKR